MSTSLYSTTAPLRRGWPLWELFLWHLPATSISLGDGMRPGSAPPWDLVCGQERTLHGWLLPCSPPGSSFSDDVLLVLHPIGWRCFSAALSPHCHFWPIR